MGRRNTEVARRRCDCGRADEKSRRDVRIIADGGAGHDQKKTDRQAIVLSCGALATILLLIVQAASWGVAV